MAKEKIIYERADVERIENGYIVRFSGHLAPVKKGDLDRWENKVVYVETAQAVGDTIKNLLG